MSREADGLPDDLHAVAPSNATVQQPKRNTCRARDRMDFLLRRKQQWIGFLQHPLIPIEKATVKHHGVLATQTVVAGFVPEPGE